MKLLIASLALFMLLVLPLAVAMRRLRKVQEQMRAEGRADRGGDGPL